MFTFYFIGIYNIGAGGRKWEFMFFGSYEHLLDEKNRLVIPSKFRGLLGSKVYILKGFDGCLSLFTENDFNAYLKKLSNLEFGDKLAREVQRISLSTVFDLEVDKASRIQIPTALVNKYHITHEVTVVGMIDHIEVWSKEKWNEYVSANEKNYEVSSEKLLKKEND